MPQISFEGKHYDLAEKETVLDGLLRHGVAVRSSCRTGVCQSCIMRAIDHVPPPESQKGLKQSLKSRNHFLACQCHPTTDMEVALPGDDDLPWYSAKVVGKDILSDRVVQLTLRYPDNFSFQAGQFINIMHDAVIRSYSIANVPHAQSTIELHIYRIDNGRMSTWIHNRLAVGEYLQIQGPFGDCVYTPGTPEQPLLLIGTGCGLAALRGVIHSALEQGHTAPIHFFHGSRSVDGVYMRDEMRALAQDHPQFHYTACVSKGDTPHGYTSGRATDIAFARHPHLQGWRVFVCGNSDMVKTAKRLAYIAGVSLSNIHSDPFEFNHRLCLTVEENGTCQVA
jgi:ferredoxin-NADP reductase/ferredoxin